MLGVRSYLNKGSYTIEAILILSTLLIILFLLCFSFMMMYHRVLLTKTASFVAQQAAKEWHREQGLYHRVMELAQGSKTFVQTVEGDLTVSVGKRETGMVSGQGVAGKCQAIQKEVLVQLYKTIKKPKRTTVEVQYNSGLIAPEVKVVIIQEVAVPFGQLKKFFSGKDTVILMAEEKVIITEPAEFIRNADLLVECAERAGHKVNLSDFRAKLAGLVEN
ncbi:MAG: hypothetical protein ACOX2N_07960 [Peptococcia bacterium]|jgi:hypothetical protein